jgi:Ca2+-binding RTX toxin-like protein
MGIMSSRRSAAGGLGLAGFACVMALALAGQAGAATTTYPAGGSSFSGGSEGWEGSGESCSLLSGITLLCATTNAYDGAVGDPAGSLTTRVDVTLNVLSLFQGTGTWQSPVFTPATDGPVTDVSFSFDRRVDSGGLLNLQPSSNVVVTLWDETAASATPVATETLTNDNAEFSTRTVALPAAAIAAGHSYRLRIATTTSSSTVGLLGQANTRFDNVRLTVADGASTGGPDRGGETPDVTTGVEVIRRVVTDREVSSLISRYGIDSEAGKGQGGSLIPSSKCTIVGTPGRDRIVATSANEIICGRGGNDVIQGGGGRDVVDGGDGADRLGGGAGSDLLLALRGNDRVRGGAGRDAIGGGAGRDALAGGAGADRLSGRSGNDRIAGNAGNDRIAGGARRDRLTGGRGHDRLAGGSGADRLLARDRTRDSLFGGAGRDSAVVDSAARSRSAARRADRVSGVERLR